MVKSALISVISEEEKWGFVEFQAFHFTSKIRRLASHFKISKSLAPFLWKFG
ncbi:unnamed protein product [Coffea canephora]|uniref:Uncharacterized protein n=1 Tax=Coffea canephora TaxID=49390 RepID=A0A068VAY6_COFCA|nr:unnamed protein product [Coffea canephora]